MEIEELNETTYKLIPIKGSGTDECIRDMDDIFTYIYDLQKEGIVLVFDLRERSFTLNEVLKIRQVVEKYREKTRLYQKCAYLVVEGVLKRTILNLALKMIRTEKPVKIVEEW